MKKILEQELVAGIRKNDPAAKETMYRMYRDEFIGWSFKTLNMNDKDRALSIYTDACVSSWSNIVSGKYEFRPGVTFKTYLFSVAANIWRNHLRAEGRQPLKTDLENIELPEDSAWQAPDSLLEPVESEDMEEKKRKIVRDVVFNHMTEPCTSIFRYVYYEKLKYRDIARKMSYSTERVVITQASRCRKKLEVALKDRFKESGLL